MDLNATDRIPMVVINPLGNKSEDYRTDEHRTEQVSIFPAIHGSSIAINSEVTADDFKSKELILKVDTPEAATYV